MPRWRCSLQIGLVAWVGLCWATAAAGPPVSLELVTEQGFPVGGQQKWLAVLKDLGFDNLRIRSARAGDKAEVEPIGEGDRRSYRVVGILTANNKLFLPGGQFALHDRARIVQWLKQLRGAAGDQEAAFGLTSKELVALHDALGRKSTVGTAGQPAAEVVKALEKALPVPVVVHASAQPGLASDFKLLEEMRGASCGAAMAAALRPLGLVLVPAKTNGQVRLYIVDVRKAPESWPVGWPLDEKDRDALPKLFDFLNVEIQDIPLLDAVSAIQGRLETPILFDHNSLARQRIDLEKIRVSLPPGRTYYRKVLERLLRTAELKFELRVDEAGDPIIWVSPIKGG